MRCSGIERYPNGGVRPFPSAGASPAKASDRILPKGVENERFGRKSRPPYCKFDTMIDDAFGNGRCRIADQGGLMNKAVALAVAAVFAASPAWAAKSKKMTKEQAEAAEIAKQHDNTRRAVRDALPLVLPSWSLPIFFGMHMDEKLKEGDKKK
jgi:hypothetical protein